jgi:hypothetical protein
MTSAAMEAARVPLCVIASRAASATNCVRGCAARPSIAARAVGDGVGEVIGLLRRVALSGDVGAHHLPSAFCDRDR